MRTALILLLGAAAVAALPKYGPNRIVGGSVASIQQYPFAVSMLRQAGNGVFSHWCGGTIINNRAILSASHCFTSDPHTYLWRHRVGSSNSNSGGSMFNTQQIINHPEYNWGSLDMDFTVVRIEGTFSFNNNVQPASIAGTNYPIPDNSPVWVIGWGATCYWWCEGSQQLQQIQVYTVNWNTCRQRYAERNRSVTNNMLCTGLLDVGGREACSGDSGGPVIHNNVVVGVISWSHECALARYPGVNARVSVASNWIVANS